MMILPRLGLVSRHADLSIDARFTSVSIGRTLFKFSLTLLNSILSPSFAVCIKGLSRMDWDVSEAISRLPPIDGWTGIIQPYMGRRVHNSGLFANQLTVTYQCVEKPRCKCLFVYQVYQHSQGSNQANVSGNARFIGTEHIQEQLQCLFLSFPKVSAHKQKQSQRSKQSGK